MLQSVIGRVRAIGIVEGISYLVLLGIAMPLKYLMGMPAAVKMVGWVHGALFVTFCAALGHALIARRLNFLKCVGVFFAALVPFGTFAIDGWLKRLDEE